MEKENLKIKNDPVFIKGEVVDFNLKTRKVVGEFDLTKIFKNPDKKNLQLDFHVNEAAKIKKLEIKIESGKAVDEGGELPADLDDLENGDYFLISFESEEELLKFLKDEESRRVGNLLIYK